MPQGKAICSSGFTKFSLPFVRKADCAEAISVKRGELMWYFDPLLVLKLGVTPGYQYLRHVVLDSPCVAVFR